MMKTYNEAQEKLLNDNNYFTLRELNITKDRSSELPLFNIYYDESDEVFGIQIFGTIMDNPNIIKRYSEELNKRIELIKKLNELRDK